MRSSSRADSITCYNLALIAIKRPAGPARRDTENMMSASILLYNPTAVRIAGAETTTQTLAALSGKVVGFIDNAKPNFDHLVDDLAGLLIARYGVAKIIKRKKRAASVPADDAVYRELAEHCDLVITGSGV